MTHVIGYTRKGKPVFSISGGSDDGGITVGDPQAPAPQQNSGEQPPATPAPTHQVDPNAFNRGAVEQRPDAADQAAEAARGSTNPQTGRTFTEAEVERIRQEEKDKLYGRVNDLTEELKREREERESEKRRLAEEEARSEEERRRQSEEGTDVRELLRQKEQEWNNKFQQLEQAREQDQALLEKERQFNALQEYQRNLITQHENDIMPELRDTVGGNSEEEVQASVQRAIDKTNTILGNIQAAQQAQQQATPTARVTQPGAGGPMEQTEGATRTYTPDDIRGMSMSDYAQKRKDFLAAASRRGPYGG